MKLSQLKGTALFAIALATFGCSGSASDPAPGPSAPPPVAPTPAPTPTPEPAPTAPEPTPPPEPPAPPGPVFVGPVATDLGPATIDAIRGATQVEVGRMRVIGALQAEQARLSAPNRILGYPVVGSLRTLDPAQRDALVQVLLDDASYIPELRRCANRDLLGARFTNGTTVVEFALGRPCDQGFFAFTAAGTPQTAGSVMSDVASQAIDTIIDP